MYSGNVIPLVPSITRERYLGRFAGAIAGHPDHRERLVDIYRMLHGRAFVTPEDVKRLAAPVLAHRIVREYGSMDRRSGEQLLNELLEQTPVPTEPFER